MALIMQRDNQKCDVFNIVKRMVKTNQDITSEKCLEAKTSPLFLWHIFIYFMDKEPCTKFCGMLIRFHEVLNKSVSEVISANVQNISPLVFFASFS